MMYPYLTLDDETERNSFISTLSKTTHILPHQTSFFLKCLDKKGVPRHAL